MTEQTIPTEEQVKEQFERITMARVRLLLNKSFFGSLATRLKVIDATQWCPTAGTDGKHLYINVNFCKNLDDEEILFLLGHEVFHCVYDHFSRRDDRDPHLFNVAADFVINLQLEDEGFKLIRKVPICHDYKYRGMITEEVYDMLKQEQEDQGSEQQQYNTLDEHMDAMEEAVQNGTAQTDPSGKTGPVPMTEDEKTKLKDELKEAVIQASENAGAGNVPAGICRIIKEWTDPQLDSKELLNGQIQSCLKDDFTWMRPSRKNQGTNAILPGMNNAERVDVAVCVDTSGSVTEQMVRDFFGEVKGILDQFQDFSLKLWCFDGAVHNYIEMSPETIDSIDTYDVQGGGGTDFMANWDFMKENDIVPQQLVMFTDGYPWGDWGDPEYCDALFVVHGNENIKAPFGVTVNYKR